MVNNYDAVLACINAFLIANAPPGAERDLARVKRQLDAGDPSAFIGIEFRPTDDVGAQLYVRVDDPNGRFDSARIMDAEGNRWYAYVVRCEVSWASWGSSDVATCQRRVACMAEVVRFAAEVERAFAGVFHRLDATAAEIEAAKVKAAEERVLEAIKKAVRANSKGMKVGQTKSAVVDMDISSVKGEVIVDNHMSGRAFKYSASVEHGILTGERGLVYFMRLEA